MRFRLLLLFGFFALVAWGTFLSARAQAQKSRRAKRAYIILGLLGMVAGGAIGIALPEWVPMNRDSPGGIFIYLACWIGGGTVGLLCTASLAGAVSASPVE